MIVVEHRNSAIKDNSMLMLTRKPGQLLLIEPVEDLPPETTVGDLFRAGPIQIVVSKIDGRQVCLGIEAPASLGVWRQELGACPVRKPCRRS
jgi:sRNA-binding carbon storage regulator CsrA